MRVKRVRLWDEERIGIIVSGYMHGYSDKELAQIVDVTPEQVRLLAVNQKLVRKRPYDDERLKIIESGYLNDVPVADIAAFIGATINEVYQGARKMGVQRSKKALHTVLIKRPPQTSFWDKEKDDFLRHHYPYGTPVRAIAEILGCNRNMVIGRARRLNLVHGQNGKTRFKLRLAA